MNIRASIRRDARVFEEINGSGAAGYDSDPSASEKGIGEFGGGDLPGDPNPLTALTTDEGRGLEGDGDVHSSPLPAGVTTANP